MSTLCLRRLCTRSSPLLRHIYTCENVAASTPVLLNNPRLQKSLYPAHPRFVTQPNSVILRCYSDKVNVKIRPDEKPQEKKSLLQRFKEMYRDYWYVLVPVHLVTSAGWFGGFYYLAKSGVDIAGLLESWSVSEKITNSLRDSSMGYVAVAYGLYKLATPVRYTVTLGGTTISINYLKQWGYIKPVPSRTELKEMYKERRENIMETIKETKGFYKEKKDNIMESVSETKLQFKFQKDQLKDQKDSLVKDFEKGLSKIKKVKEDLASKPENLMKISKKEESS